MKCIIIIVKTIKKYFVKFEEQRVIMLAALSCGVTLLTILAPFIIKCEIGILFVTIFDLKIITQLDMLSK